MQPLGTPTHSPAGFGFGTGEPQLPQKNLRYPGGRSTTGSSNKRMRSVPEVKRNPWTATRTIAAYADPVDVRHRLQWQSSNGAIIEAASNWTVPHKHLPLIIGRLRLSGRLTSRLWRAVGGATRRRGSVAHQSAVRRHHFLQTHSQTFQTMVNTMVPFISTFPITVVCPFRRYIVFAPLCMGTTSKQRRHQHRFHNWDELARRQLMPPNVRVVARCRRRVAPRRKRRSPTRC